MSCSRATTAGCCCKRMEECVDGDFQAYKAKDGAYLREEFFGKYPELLELVKDYTDEQLIKLHRGGHDPAKVYNAYKRAVEHKGGPTVILAKTVKGYGLGTAQSRNATHSGEEADRRSAWRRLCKQFDIPVPGRRRPSMARPTGRPQDSPEIGVHAGAARRAGRIYAEARGARS